MNRMTRMVLIAVAALAASLSIGVSASGAAAAPVRVVVYSSAPANAKGLKVKPDSLVYTGDGSKLLKSIKWTRWSATDALGTATDRYDLCTQGCAGGPWRSYPVHVELFYPHKEHGVTIFVGMKITFTHQRPTGQPKMIQLSAVYQSGGFYWTFIG